MFVLEKSLRSSEYLIKLNPDVLGKIVVGTDCLQYPQLNLLVHFKIALEYY